MQLPSAASFSVSCLLLAAPRRASPRLPRLSSPRLASPRLTRCPVAVLALSRRARPTRDCIVTVYVTVDNLPCPLSAARRCSSCLGRWLILRDFTGRTRGRVVSRAVAPLSVAPSLSFALTFARFFFLKRATRVPAASDTSCNLSRAKRQIVSFDDGSRTCGARRSGDARTARHGNVTADNAHRLVLYTFTQLIRQVPRR